MHFFPLQTVRRFFTLSLTLILFIVGGLMYAENGECQETGSSLTNNTFNLAVNRPEGTFYYEFLSLIYSDIFKRMNINLNMAFRPLKRAGIETNIGKMDGEPARIYAYASSFPNLIRIEESVFPMTVNAYTTDSSIAGLNGWESLKNKTLRVEYPGGMKICDNNLPRVVKAELLTTIPTTSQGLRKLASNRIDLLVDDSNSVLPLLKQNKFDLQDKIFEAGTMETVPLYMYIHKKHKSLVPKLVEAITAVKSEGLVDEYRIKAIEIISSK